MQRHRVGNPEAVGPHALGVSILSQHQRDLQGWAKACAACASGTFMAVGRPSWALPPS